MVDVHKINIVTMVHVLVIQVSQELIAILELALMIVLDTDIASTDHAIVVQVGQVMIVH